jgi:pimeloyl-ACP methyl ester carboxylesterase
MITRLLPDNHARRGVLALFSFFTLFLISKPGEAQFRGQNIVDTGDINGAHYRIDIPANWNHNLVVYAHGYNAGSFRWPLSINGSFDSGFVKLYNGLGFALARSEYRIPRGWAWQEGLDDTEALREYFVKKYGKPDTSFITGHSMGGGITLESVEKYPGNYAGAMPMCPLSSGPYYQLRQAFDLIAVFNAMYPGTLPSLETIMTGKARIVAPGPIAERIKSDTVPISQLATMNEYRLGDMPLIIFFTQSVLKDLAVSVGGNPFDNTNTVYAGFGNDLGINQKIERLASTNGADKKLQVNEPTGNISRPVVIVHTIYDELINPTMGVFNYDTKVHRTGNEKNLVVFYTAGQGHCRFTMQETATAFETLRKWAATGVKPAPGRLP